MITHSSNARDWVLSMVSHACCNGRAFFQNDDPSQRQIGYECDSCGEIFAIRIDSLKKTATPGFLSSLKNRDEFGRKVSGWSESLVRKAFKDGNSSFVQANSSTVSGNDSMNNYSTLDALKTGVLIRIR